MTEPEFTPEQIALAQQAAARLLPGLVEHSGQFYIFDGPCNPQAQLICGVQAPDRRLDALFECFGSHEGEFIKIVAVGCEVYEDLDECGYHRGATYARLEWLDDRTECPPDVDDAYADVIRDDLADWLLRR